MAAENWMEIYRSYTPEELAEEITQLKKDLRGGFTAQGSGSVNHQRDVSSLEARLQGATRVQNERANRHQGNPMKGTVDFRGGRWGSL
jgi:hypothetical protein